MQKPGFPVVPLRVIHADAASVAGVVQHGPLGPVFLQGLRQLAVAQGDDLAEGALLVPPAVLDGVLVDRLGKFIQFHHRF